MTGHRKSATALTAIAFISFILASCNDNGDDLKIWLTSTPITPPTNCPTAPTEPVPGPPGTALAQKPFFRLGKEARDAFEQHRPMSCLEDGPYAWHDTQWYVQRINFVNAEGQKHAAVRVCSLDAVVGKDGPALDLIVKTPGGDLQYVSENKCQVVSSY